MTQSRLLSTLSIASATDVARAGFEGMMAGRAIVVPGVVNSMGIRLLRVTSRAVIRRVVRAMQEKR